MLEKVLFVFMMVLTITSVGCSESEKDTQAPKLVTMQASPLSAIVG